MILPRKFPSLTPNNFTGSNFTGTEDRQNRDIMQKHGKRNGRRRRKREIVLAALLSGVGVLAGDTAARAAGMAANTVISNTASAT